MSENISGVRLNLGCGGQPLPEYVNVDSDNLETLKVRYPHQEFPEGVEVFQYDIFNLPFEDGTVAEIRTDSLLEHLSFAEEPRFFLEVKRVLRPGGLFNFATTNFEAILKLWLNAKDEWKEFYRCDEEAIAQSHWFGTYSYSTDNRWGYLAAMIYGSQNGEGQYHKNCYTASKIRAILSKMDFQELELSEYKWKGDRDPMLRVKAIKLKE